MKSLVIVLLVLHISLSDAMINSEQAAHQPYYAYLSFIGPARTFYGGGALISNLHVLTTGANVHGFTAWRVGLGANRRQQHQTIDAARAIAHPNYAEANGMRVNDVAVIFLNQAIPLTQNIFPIFLPPLNPAKNHPMLNIQGMVLGYAGSNSAGIEGLDVLQGAHVRTITQNECTPHYPALDAITNFCAADMEFRSNFCMGDQGGAFTVISREEEFLVAMASLPGCGTMPSLYVRVGPFREWIQSQTGI